MENPHTEDQGGKDRQQVHLVAANVIHKQRGTLPEKITCHGKGHCPDKRTRQIEEKKTYRGKGRHTEDYRENDSETVGISRDECDKGSVLFNEPQGFTELAGDKGEHLEQPRPLPPPKVKVELVAEERAPESRCNYPRELQVSLESKESGQDKPCFALKESPQEENPIAVLLQIFTEQMVHAVTEHLRSRLFRADKREKGLSALFKNIPPQ